MLKVTNTGPSAISRVLHNAAQSRTHKVDQPARETLRFRRVFNKSESVMLGEKALNTLNKAPIPFCKAEVAVKEREGRYHIINAISQDIVKPKHGHKLATPLQDSNQGQKGKRGLSQSLESEDNRTDTIVFLSVLSLPSSSPTAQTRARSCDTESASTGSVYPDYYRLSVQGYSQMSEYFKVRVVTTHWKLVIIKSVSKAIV